MKDLALIEEMILLSVWKLKDNAYGVTLRQHISEKTKRLFPYGTLYSTLDKMVGNGYLTKKVSEPLPERGGRSRNYYHITSEGFNALKAALELKQALWDKETEMKFIEG
jgi:PadR family transcriptional regulator PadR